MYKRIERKKNLKTISMRIPEGYHAKLKAEAKQKGVTISDLIWAKISHSEAMESDCTVIPSRRPRK